MTTMRSLLRRSSSTPRFCVLASAFHRLWAIDGLSGSYPRSNKSRVKALPNWTT
jgi:hypothetical protein